jgi:hypothetical protein
MARADGRRFRRVAALEECAVDLPAVARFFVVAAFFPLEAGFVLALFVAEDFAWLPLVSAVWAAIGPIASNAPNSPANRRLGGVPR